MLPHLKRERTFLRSACLGRLSFPWPSRAFGLPCCFLRGHHPHVQAGLIPNGTEGKGQVQRMGGRVEGLPDVPFVFPSRYDHIHPIPRLELPQRGCIFRNDACSFRAAGRPGCPFGWWSRACSSCGDTMCNVAIRTSLFGSAPVIVLGFSVL